MRKILLFISLSVFFFGVSQSYAETPYERVMRTKTLRCGYFLEYPVTFMNMKTGELEGIVPDLTYQLAEDLGLEVEWSEEIHAGTMIEGLNTGRYDVLCAGIMALASRAHLLEHTIPFVYTPLTAYVRVDDDRFNDDLYNINAPEHTIMALDGSGKTLMAVKTFDKAKISMLPQFSTFAELFVNVAQKKADMTFTSPSEFRAYDRHNPNTLKAVGNYSVIPLVFNVKSGAYRLKNVIDTAFMTYFADGKMDRIIDKWEEHPDDFYRVSEPFRK